MIRQAEVKMRDFLYEAPAIAQSIRHSVNVMQQAGKNMNTE